MKAEADDLMEQEKLRETEGMQKRSQNVYQKRESRIISPEEAQVSTWKTCKQVIIDWRIPSNNWRVMLFEKIEYLISQSKTK